MSSRIQIDYGKLAVFCKENHIRKLSLFGSVLTDNFRDDSDVDVLVEFDQGHPIGLIKMAQMELELSALLGRKADLRTPNDLSRYFRNRVLADAEVQYAA